MIVRAAGGVVVVAAAFSTACATTPLPSVNDVDPLAEALVDFCAEVDSTACSSARDAALALATSTPKTPARQPLAAHTAVVLFATEQRDAPTTTPGLAPALGTKVVGEVVAGDVVTVRNCTTTPTARVCEVDDANGVRAFVRADALGTRGDVLAARVSTALAPLIHHTNDAVADLVVLVEAALEAHHDRQRLDTFKNVVASAQLPTSSSLRLGLVGRHIVLGDLANLPRDGEQVLALCKEGAPHAVTAKVTTAAATNTAWPTAHDVTIAITVPDTCEAAAVLAGAHTAAVTAAHTLELGEQTRALFVRNGAGLRVARYGLGLQQHRWPVPVHGTLVSLDVDNDHDVDAVVSARLFDLPVTMWEVVTSSDTTLSPVVRLIEITE